MVARWLDGLLTGIVVKSGAGSHRLRRAGFPTQLTQFVAEDRQLLADGLAQYVGLAEVARDQALHLGPVDEGIQLIVQRLSILTETLTSEGSGVRFFVGGMGEPCFYLPVLRIA